jgi:hypothetical protein
MLPKPEYDRVKGSTLREVIDYLKIDHLNPSLLLHQSLENPRREKMTTSTA